jgi:4-amino-4-deoxy-L-arabinose transferase-like glycosyltransferase
MKLTQPRVVLALIVVVYLVLAVLYAVYTPAWQAPDEPAHYNYVRYLVQNHDFPVLHQGDYPHGYLEQIKAAKFPPGMPIDTIRYEFHQPPLYYALGAVLFSLAGDSLLLLRLFSVVLGAGLIVLAYAVARRIFPAWPALALGTAAFVAFLPRHLASVAQAGNDTLAELLFAAVLLVLVNWLTTDAQPGTSHMTHDASGTTARPMPRDSVYRLLLLGLLLGLIAITKTTAYFSLALILGVMVWAWRRQRAPATRLVRDLALVAAPAVLLALPWYVRDVSVYGWPDFLGLRMHDAIVTGQPRTADYLAQSGLPNYLLQFLVVTFESFWAVFGWMGVFLDERIYQALAILCAVVAGGVLLHEPQARRPGALSQGQRYALRLLAVSALFSVLVYAWYNLQFVQFQGRYLFTALIPVAVAFGLGWDEATRNPRSARILAGGLVFLAVVIAAWGLLRVHALPKWPSALALAAALFLAGSSLLPRRTPSQAARLNALLFALPYVALPIFALYALFGAIVPQLR